MHFNMLDRNMAYCLRQASSNSEHAVSLKSVFSFAYDKKLKKIQTLIRERKRESEYSDFLNSAHQCRSLRNKLVHGHWEFVPCRHKPIRFEVPAPYEEQGYLTQDEFSAQGDFLQHTNSMFVQLQRKFPIAPA